MQLHQEDWAKLSDDEENGGSLVPILALAHENDPDPKLRPYKEPVNEERREQLIMGLAAGAMNIYKYFEPHRRMPISTDRKSTRLNSSHALISYAVFCLKKKKKNNIKITKI